MSIDPNQNMPPMGHVPPKKSGSLKWIIGGIGCFGLIALLCVGGLVGGVFWGIGLVKNEAYEEAKVSIANSAEVAEAVGAPVTVSDFTGLDQKAAGEQITYIYEIPVQGSEKSGTAEVSVTGNPLQGGWSVDSIEVDVDGEKIQVGELDLSDDIDE